MTEDYSFLAKLDLLDRCINVMKNVDLSGVKLQVDILSVDVYHYCNIVLECNVRFHPYCQPLVEHVIIREVMSLRSKPFTLDRHNECWKCTFLQTTMLHLHNSVDYILNFTL